MRKKLTGRVTSDTRDKTLRVEIQKLYKHPKYGKIVRGKTVCHVHDERNIAKVNDVVEIIESRPVSKTKRWNIVRIVKSAGSVESVDINSDGLESNGSEL
jgi:small subunit ribosomal protein S17